MALAHTILTILIDQPASGYDISKCFEDGINCFWNASQQQIYRELGKMEKENWVSPTTVPQEGRPDKKIYTVTEDGHKALISWCMQPTEPTDIREDLMVRLMAAPYVPKDLVFDELKRRREVHRINADRLVSKKDFYLAHGHFYEERRSPMDQYRYLTLLRGVRFEESWVAWCDEVLGILKDEL